MSLVFFWLSIFDFTLSRSADGSSSFMLFWNGIAWSDVGMF